MSEELKPCPFCDDGADDLSIRGDSDECYVQCDPCGTRGPYRARGIGDSQYDKAIAAWNALSRRLRWTKEKPTVEGMYWCRCIDPCRRIAGPANIMYYTPGCTLIEMYDEFAGPLPEPTD